MKTRPFLAISRMVLWPITYGRIDDEKEINETTLESRQAQIIVSLILKYNGIELHRLQPTATGWTYSVPLDSNWNECGGAVLRVPSLQQRLK